jgi:hypothetical protein
VNILGSGAVVAAPDLNTPGGSYYFHWARDAALTMYTVLTTIPSGSTTTVDTYLQAYAGWVNGTHHVQDDNNIDSRIEPKFYIPSGKPFAGAWCRPQNDAPGLRGITLTSYANTLLGTKQGKAFVQSMLWTGTDSNNNGGVIKYDLDWVATNWQSSSCDLWEEVESNDFFWNRFTMRRSMLMGAAFAKTMGDASTASKYADVASQMLNDVKVPFFGCLLCLPLLLLLLLLSHIAHTPSVGRRTGHAGGPLPTHLLAADTLTIRHLPITSVDHINGSIFHPKAHYNGQYIQEETNRQQDAAVICALNDGYADDGVFAPASKEVADTIAAYAFL